MVADGVERARERGGRRGCPITRMARAPEKTFTVARGNPRHIVWDICALKNTQHPSELRAISPCRPNTGAPVPPSLVPFPGPFAGLTRTWVHR